MRKTLGFIIGALVGGLVGATLALLYTPESGAELRGQIRDRATTFGSEVRQAVSSKRIELQERLDTLRAPKA
ncbi:MAG: YtxH domain-containing protein [Anaerolineales bacterium]|nr:YtxH domain-containing protein [Anaerolineales bacterium]